MQTIKTDTNAVPVVAIGMSAGGLTALETILAALPADTGASFVVLQHLAPDYQSHMHDLLGRVTNMEVLRANDQMKLEPNCVYVMQPGTEMIIANQRLLLTRKDPRNEPSLPIDTFLRSMVADSTSAPCAVILSGTGGDGTKGIIEIKRAGGRVIVQDPDDAQFDGMPTNAIASGSVDDVLPAHEIADALRRCIGTVHAGTDFTASDDAGIDEGIQAILDQLTRQCDVDFNVYRHSTLVRRIGRRMEILGLDTPEAYSAYLASNPRELDVLFNDILIGVTEFFRDADVFERLGDAATQHLFDEDKDELRVWVAGCATGEEAYSVAILLDQERERYGWKGRIRVFATDIHKNALAIASEGIYPEKALSGFSNDRKAKFFTKKDDSYKVVDRIREMIVFARHNMLTDAPFTQIDMVCCRNVLIYFKPDTQLRVLALFHFGLCTGGLLLLGPSETLGKLANEFDEIDAPAKLYSKRRDMRLATEVRLDRLSQSWRTSERPESAKSRDRGELELYEALCNRVMPASFVLDDSQRLLYCFGGVERFFKLRGGRISTNTLDLLSGRIRRVVASLLERLEAEPEKSHSVTVRQMTSDGDEQMAVSISRLPVGRTGKSVSLVELRTVAEAQVPAPGGNRDSLPSTEYVESLERDLDAARTRIQSSVEELEAANEELQATNEELIASNEELQSTNEELRSVNDELNTVNSQYQDKITELGEVSADLENLLHTLNVGVLFLDSDYTIRRVNRKAESLLQVAERNIGQPFGDIDISNTGMSDSLLAAMSEAKSSGEDQEREIQAGPDTALLINVIAYRDTEGPDRGLVVTAVDISSLKNAESEADRLSGLVRSARDAIISKSLEGIILSWNYGAERIYGYTEEEAVGQHISLIVPQDRQNEISLIIQQVKDDAETRPFETVRIDKQGRAKHVLLSFGPMHSSSGRIDGVSVIALDITDRKLAEERAAIAIEQRDRFLAMLSHELRNPLMAMASANEILQRSSSEDERQIRAKEIIDRQVSQMSRLLEDTLDASRMRHDKIELQRTLVDLRSIIDVAMDAVRPYASRKDIQIEQRIPEQPLNVKVDPARIQQVVVNLVQNAINHSARGQCVTIGITEEAGEAIVTVQDNGRGIDAAALTHIFEPFFQASSQEHKGLGLGLSLAKAIAEAHEGKIHASSDGLGKGLLIQVHLPVSEDFSTGTTAELPILRDKESNGEVCTVVLVEDDTSLRENLAILLRDAGYVVHEAGNGGKGINVISEINPNVAVIDVGLPDISGLEVCKQIRKLPISNRIRLLALTGFGQQSDREAAIEAGFDMHLVKPIDFPTLEKVIAYQASR